MIYTLAVLQCVFSLMLFYGGASFYLGQRWELHSQCYSELGKWQKTARRQIRRVKSFNKKVEVLWAEQIRLLQQLKQLPVPVAGPASVKYLAVKKLILLKKLLKNRQKQQTIREQQQIILQQSQLQNSAAEIQVKQSFQEKSYVSRVQSSAFHLALRKVKPPLVLAPKYIEDLNFSKQQTASLQWTFLPFHFLHSAPLIQALFAPIHQSCAVTQTQQGLRWQPKIAAAL